MFLICFFAIAPQIAPQATKKGWLYNKCCGLDENQGYNIYFFAH